MKKKNFIILACVCAMILGSCSLAFAGEIDVPRPMSTAISVVPK